MNDVPDRTERSTPIDAPAERVWALIAEPGWWINGGKALRPHRIEEQGDLVVVHDEEHGPFRLRVLALEPPRRAVFVWIPHSGGETPGETPGTTVEFTIADRAGGVLLTVVESGFGALDLPADRLRGNYADDLEGWAVELSLAKTLSEQA